MDPRRNEERQALRARQRALDELVEESQEMGISYIPEKDRLEAFRAPESLERHKRRPNKDSTL